MKKNINEEDAPFNGGGGANDVGVGIFDGRKR